MKYKELKLFLFVFGIMSFMRCIAQQNNVETGNYYSIDIFATLPKENSRPASLHLVVNDISQITVSKNNMDEMICSLLHNCRYFVNDEITILTNMKKLSNYPKDGLRKYIIDYERSQTKLNKMAFSHQFILKDGSVIKIIIEKFRGEGWLFKADSLALNNVSEQIPIISKCYLSKQYFVLKRIDISYLLNSFEKGLILNKF